MTPAERLQAAIEKLQHTKSQTTHWPAIDGVSKHVMLLWRTIDAQLTILRHELARAEAKIANGAVERHVWAHTADALALADAILGSDS